MCMHMHYEMRKTEKLENNFSSPENEIKLFCRLVANVFTTKVSASVQMSVSVPFKISYQLEYSHLLQSEVQNPGLPVPYSVVYRRMIAHMLSNLVTLTYTYILI